MELVLIALIILSILSFIIANTGGRQVERHNAVAEETRESQT